MNNNLLSDGGEPFMAARKHCPFCNELVEQDEEICPYCGEENRTPKTIEELLAYCEKWGMPLHRMRFFIGENYQKARAFGIYEDGGRYIVYKNKANGERATRYSGPDEAHAVKELFLKLLDECHKRDIYPDGRPAEELTRRQTGPADGVSPRTGKRKAKGKTAVLVVFALCIIALICIFSTFDWSFRSYENGYYQLNDSYYLKKGSYWFYGGSYDWYIRNGSPSENVVYLGNDYDPEWGIIDFEQSQAGKDYHAGKYNSYSGNNTDSGSSYSSSDYSSWDSGDTDWSSDW